MSISFTDDQLKTVSKEVVELPAQIVLLNQQKASVLASKADLLSKDNGNKAFYDHYKAALASYYTEQGELDSTTHTTYSDADLESSAKQEAGNPHYPTSPIWTKMQPKLIDSVKGNPTGTTGLQNEIATLPILNTKVTELTGGFNDGAITDSLYAAYTVGQPLKVNAGGFVVGQRVIVDAGNISLMGLITGVAPGVSTTGTCSLPAYTTQATCEGALPIPGVWTPDPPAYAQELTITVLAAPLGGLGIGARVRNFHPGFSNNEREGTTTPYAPEAMAYMRGLIDAEVTTWKTRLNAEKSALNSNPASGSEASQINTAKTNVQSALDEIALFEAAPVLGAGVGRYGDNRLNPLQVKRSDRATQAPARVTEITNAYGTLTQAGDGSSSGSGNWFSLFKWIELRIGKAGGTLFGYYSADLAIVFIDQKIAQANTKQSEYGSQMIVTKLTQDSDGSAFIKVQSVSGLSVGNAVKLIDDDSAILSATIQSINGLTVELSVTATGFEVEKIARLVKLL